MKEEGLMMLVEKMNCRYLDELFSEETKEELLKSNHIQEVILSNTTFITRGLGVFYKNGLEIYIDTLLSDDLEVMGLEIHSNDNKVSLQWPGTLAINKLITALKEQGK